MPARASPEALLEEFLRVWERLREAAARPATVVVVEGERDRESLRRLGLESPIDLVHHGAPLAEVARSIGERYRTAIVLTDWDRKGGQLAQRLKGFLEADGVTIDLDLRRRLGHALRGEVAHVEGLGGWAHRIAERASTTWPQAIETRASR
ncbi:MAG: toprim domain-containing protein [Thermoplasmata archaeon]